MKLIVGLGNPGEKYEKTRHNVGFVVLDKLAKVIPPRRDVGQSRGWEKSVKFLGEVILDKNIILLKPSTFMNESGKAVVAIKNFYKIENKDIYVVHDDLDIPLGKYKIMFGKGPQIHRGLLSVEEKLGTDEFWNVRVGIENREVRGNKGVPGVVYSLEDFNQDEIKLIDEVVNQVTLELKGVIR